MRESQINPTGIVQVYLPAKDLKESSDWYVKHLGFTVLFEDEEAMTLKHEMGPLIMLWQTASAPVKFILDEEESAVISLMYPNVEQLHQELKEKNVSIEKLVRFGEGNRYIHFNVIDPHGNKLDIGNYPDLPDMKIQSIGNQ